MPIITYTLEEIRSQLAKKHGVNDHEIFIEGETPLMHAPFFLDASKITVQRICELILSEQKLMAIKELREVCQIGLKEAKDVVDQLHSALNKNR